MIAQMRPGRPALLRMLSPGRAARGDRASSRRACRCRPRRRTSRRTRGIGCASSCAGTAATSSSRSRARWCCWTWACPSGRPSTRCTSRRAPPAPGPPRMLLPPAPQAARRLGSPPCWCRGAAQRPLRGGGKARPYPNPLRSTGRGERAAVGRGERVRGRHDLGLGLHLHPAPAAQQARAPLRPSQPKGSSKGGGGCADEALQELPWGLFQHAYAQRQLGAALHGRSGAGRASGCGDPLGGV